MRASNAKRRSIRTGVPGSGLCCIICRSISDIVGLQRIYQQTGVLADLALDLGRNLGIVLQEALGVLATLAEALAVIREPSARLFDHVGLHPKIDEFTHLGDPLAEHDVELDLLERRSNLVLDHLHANLIADRLIAI